MNPIVWVDIETTGVEDDCLLLEVALHYRDKSKSLVIGHPNARDRASPFVQKMHDKNGLWDDVAVSDLDTAEVEKQLVEWWTLVKLPERPLMGGFSVHGDRSWLKKHMRSLHDLFHYRNMDVSCLRNFFGVKPSDLGQSKHRAHDDNVRAYRTFVWYKKRAQLIVTP